MRKRFIHILWALLGAGILFCILGFVAVWNGLIGYMPEICHPGLLCRWQGAWYVEPEQGEQNRDTLRQDVAPPRRGTRCHRGRAFL